MKIAMTCNTMWGMVKFRKNIIRYFIYKGIDVVVMAPFDGSQDELIALGCRCHNVRIDNKGKNPLIDLCLVAKYYRFLRKENPKICFNYTIKPAIYCSIAAWLEKLNTISVITGLGSGLLGGYLLRKTIENMYRVALAGNRMVLFLNNDDKNYFHSRGIVSDNKGSVLDGEGVDIDYFSPMATSEPPPKFVFLMISRLLYDKGIVELCSAAKHLKNAGHDFECWIVGKYDNNNPSGIAKSDFERIACDGGVKYLGFINDVRPVIAQASCVVLPSYREGLPMVLLEAAAMEKPLIASDVPGCRDVVIDGRNGFLCKARDSTSLSNSMETMLTMSDSKAKEMGRHGRGLVVERFSDSKVIESYVDVLRGFCAFDNLDN